MVYKPIGLREGSTGRDPTADYAVRDAYLELHKNVGAHGQTYTIRPSDCRRNVRLTIQNASVKNFDASAFGVVADNMFDVEINGAPVHTLIDLYLHFFIFNNNPGGGRSITMMAPHAFFNRQEVMSNGSFTDDTIYSEQMYHDYFTWLASDSERQARAASVGMETMSRPANNAGNQLLEVMFDETFIPIAPQTSREYFFPVINFMTTSSLWLCTKVVEPKFRFFSNINPIMSSNDPLDIATPNIRFQRMEVIYFGLLYEPAIRTKISEVMSSSLHLTRCLVHDRMQQTINSVVANTYLTDIQLTVFMGEYAELILYVSRGDATIEGKLYGSNRTWSAATGSPLPLGNTTFNDSSGYPIFFNDHPVNIWRFAIEPSVLKYPSVNSVKAFYPFYFCTDPTLTLQSGISSGGCAMDGNFILRTQLKTFTVGATTSVVANIIGRRYAILQCRADGTYVLQKL